MDRWSPFEQPFSHPICGSPHLPTPLPPEDSLNFGASNSNPLIPTCGLLSVPDPVVTTGLSEPTYETLLPPNHLSKETEFYDDNLFSSDQACKDNLMGGQNFLQAQGSATRAEAFSSDSTHGYSNQVPTQCQPNIKRGSFGVLPHESVNNHAPKYSTPSSVSYKNGPYTDNDGSNIYSTAPLSAQSAFSGDTTSHSPVFNPVASPVLSNFSSPSDYYSSPKQNFGAYNSTRSPVPLSPSVAQSFPSSPFTNVDHNAGHISSAPPMSPMSSKTYINNISNIPPRNNQKTQHSPSNTSANMCYNTQDMTYGPQPIMRKTPPDFHSDYNAFGPEHNSPSSYNSVYSSQMHQGHMSSGNNTRMSQRAQTPHPNPMSHDGGMTYSNSNTITHVGMSSPPYIQNQVTHDNYRPYPSGITSGQSMHPPSYSHPMNTNQNSNLHLNTSSAMPDQHFNFLPDPEPPKHYDHPFGVPVNQPDLRNSHYLGSDIQMMERNETSNRQLRPSEIENQQNPLVNLENTARNMTSTLPVSKEAQNEMRSFETLNYNYGSSQLDPVRRGNFSLTATGRRRGRRGRRRKADINSGNIPRYQPFKDRTVYSNGYPHQPNDTVDYGCSNSFDTYSKRLCDEKELPPVNYSFSRYRSELKMLENQKKNLSIILSKPAKRCISIEDELSFLGQLKFSDESDNDNAHTFMKTRNKNSEGFLQCYRNFLTSRKTKPTAAVKTAEVTLQSKTVCKDSSHSSKEHKNKKILPKIIIKRDSCNKDVLNWRLERSVPPDPMSGDESASDSSEDIPISSHIKKENDAEGKSKRLKHSSKLNKVSKHSANSKRTARIKKCIEMGESSQTNAENFLLGQVKIKTEIESSPEREMEPTHPPRKKGRKSKTSESHKKAKKSQRKHHSSDAPDETIAFTSVKIKQELIDDEKDGTREEGTRRTLRSRKSDAGTSVEPIPGPSATVEDGKEIAKQSINISSDDDIELCDDSDSDPAWTPSAKPQKGVEHVKTALQLSPKKRGPKPGRRSSTGGAIPRQKKEKSEGSRKRTSSERGKKGSRTQTVEPIKVKKEKERFLIAKEDLDKENPFLWRIDKETNMLQRFEWYEQQGIILYRSTYTYAAWNENSCYSYITANVRIISHSRVLFVVEYLGPDHVTKVENPAQQNEGATTAPVYTNPLRENFEVFLQTLISQALDPNFLTEITEENDEYFLSHINEIESVSEKKKLAIKKENWDDTLLTSLNTYPAVEVVRAAGGETVDCEVCKKNKSTVLLQLQGDPYNSATLGTTNLSSPPQAQFNVCDSCSATLSLYVRLQHQKYNFFVKCRGKMNDVIGASSDNVETHALLDECLQDHTWVDSLFSELEALWKQCDSKS